MKHIYLDNAGTTPMNDEVIEVMTETMKNTFGNASTPSYFGRQARSIMDDSRSIIAQSIKAKDSEIVFTSGGTEGDNTAIIKSAMSRKKFGKHIITTKIEHEAVLKPMKYLEEQGFDVTYLDVDEHGQISLEEFKNVLDDQTILVSIMMVNNEIGTINPIKEIGEILQDHQAIFHTDAVQAYGLMNIDVNDLKVDLLTTSAHKINGPKMIGFIYEREGINLPPMLMGGNQETKRRAGTENIPAIAGFSKAVQMNNEDVKAESRKRFNQYKHILVDELTKNNIQFEVNGPTLDNSAPNIINIWLKGFETSAMQINLDLAGYIVSGGSACTAGSLEPSHVLTAMYGEKSPKISESIRVSLGKNNTKDDILGLADEISKIIKKA